MLLETSKQKEILLGNSQLISLNTSEGGKRVLGRTESMHLPKVFLNNNRIYEILFS